MENYISKDKFKLIAGNLIKHTIQEEFWLTIDYKNLVPQLFKGQKRLSYDELLENYTKKVSPSACNFIKQVILTHYALDSFESQNKINTLFVWRLLYDTLLYFRKNDPISGLSSAGFLAIELYRFEENSILKILRLHLWSETFSNSFQKNEFSKYKVHSHLFNAQSHMLNGKILNKRFTVNDSVNPTDLTLYKIIWKLNDDPKSPYKRQSKLEVDRVNVQINNISTELISSGQSYTISVNEFHSSESISPLSATLFLFNSEVGKSEYSMVVGPSNDVSPGFKYEKINYLPLLHQIDRNIRDYYNKQILLSLDWMRKIHILELAHRIESRKLKSFSDVLTWLLVFLPAIMSAMALYLKLVPNGEKSLLVWLAILAGLSTLVGTILKIANPGDLSEKHRLNSEKFERIRHKIEKHIVFNNDERLESYLDTVRTEWEQLTLLNVKQRNFNKATKWVLKMNKYPKNLEFIDEVK